MKQFIHTETETISKARELTPYSLRELVGDEMEDWSDEKIEREAYESASITVSEANYAHSDIRQLIDNRAMTMWQDDLRRLSIDVFRTDDPEKLILAHDVWPNKMDKWQCREIIEDAGIQQVRNEYVTEAMLQVESGIARELMDK